MLGNRTPNEDAPGTESNVRPDPSEVPAVDAFGTSDGGAAPTPEALPDPLATLPSPDAPSAPVRARRSWRAGVSQADSDSARARSNMIGGLTRRTRRSDLPTDIEQYYDVNRYRRTHRRRARISTIKVVAVALISLVMLAGIAVALYVSDIDARLHADITEGLRDQLEHSEPGEPFYLLLLGIDKDQGRIEDTENYGADEHAYRSDSIMLCRIDPQKVKVTMVSIHRDTLIDMDEHGRQKINAAYAFGGAEYATEIVSEFAGVPISHYAEVDLDRFIAIVDVIGGVTVNLPVPVYDPEYTGLNLPAGEQTLNGLEAALLCRCRHGYDEYGDGDLFRAANQRMVFSQIVKTVMRSDPATIVATITQMADSVNTDMSLASILDLAGQMQSINVDTDIMTGMEPTEGVQIGDGWYEVCITSAWNKMMNRVNQGLPPYEDGEYDKTAGVAGGVGEAGAAAAEAANADRAAAEAASAEDEEATSEEATSEDVAYTEEPVYTEEYYEPEVYYYDETW